MPAAYIAIMIANQMISGLGWFIEPTPTPYIAADYYGYHVGVGKTIKNQPPVQQGAKVKWKENWGPF